MKDQTEQHDGGGLGTTVLDREQPGAEVSSPAPEEASASVRLGPARRDVAAMSGLVVVMGFLWGRGRHVWYWIDEGIAIGIASHPFTTIPALLRQDGSPPLYYLALHVWMAVFGSSESATHLLSLLFALAILPAALWAGWSLFGRRTGWMFVALAALNPFVAYYANETRMYSLAALLSLLATATFLHAFVYGRRRYLPVFVASLTLLVYTHNWGLFFSLGLGAALVLVAITANLSERKRVLLDGVLGFGAVGVLYLPWAPTLLYQLAHSGAPWLLRPTLELVREDVISLLGTNESVLALGIGAVGALIAVLRWPWRRTATATAAATAVLMVTVAIGWLVSRQDAVWTYRYLAVLVAPLLLVLAVGLARGGRLAVTGLVLYGFLIAPIDVKGQPYDKSNVKDIAAQVSPVLQTDDLVISSFGRTPVLAQYLPPGLRYAETTGAIPDVRRSDQRDAVRHLEERPPQVTLPPLLDAVAVGGHVVVVCPPVYMLQPDGTVFPRLISSQCREALAMVTNEGRFRLDASVSAVDDTIEAPEDGYLFTRLATPTGTS